MNLFKRKIDDADEIERKARRIASDYSEILEKYDERTEEIISLLREKSAGLYDCKKYYDMALEFKDDIKELKSERSEKQQDINLLKKEWGELGLYLIKSGLFIKPQQIDSYEVLIKFLQAIQYSDKSELPVRGIVAAIKRLKVSKSDIETNYPELYTNLRMKDWEV